VWGCGTIGLETIDCAPLDRHLGLDADADGCPSPFYCGEDPASEGLHVTKGESDQGGGALCCSDAQP
jgi:hypothetical protein